MDATDMPRKGLVAASSLLESVLALGLLAGAMSIAVLVHSETLMSDHATAHLQAWSMTEEAINRLETTGKAESAVTSDNMSLTMEVSMLDRGCEHVRLTCLEGSHVILERDVILEVP
jgi:hypothetical protein